MVFVCVSVGPLKQSVLSGVCSVRQRAREAASDAVLYCIK
jgi:hypothetical protein